MTATPIHVLLRIWGDTRIRAAIALDLGPAAGFTTESLKNVNVPVMVLAATKETPEIAAIKADSEYVAKQLPKDLTTYKEISDATHFSFMQLCKPDGEEIIEEEAPGEGFICRDGDSRGRAEIHRQVADEIVEFLNQNLN